MVDNGDVRQEDLIGNDGADTAADLGRLRQQDTVITARLALFRARRHWYPIMLELHKFMVATSRIEVNHDGYGGTAPDAMIWDEGSVPKPLASSIRVTIDHPFLPGPLGFWTALGVACLPHHHSGGCSCLALQSQHLSGVFFLFAHAALGSGCC